MVELGDYPAVLARNLNSCVREPSTFLAVLVVQLDGGARLDFVQVRDGGLHIHAESVDHQWGS
jgi:hypothetical protein